MDNTASKLPKLKVTDWSYGHPEETVREFEQAKDFLNLDPTLLVMVEGEVLVSYNELIRLVGQGHYQGKECLHVELVPLVGGG